MSSEIFIALLFGHLAGDYLLQSKKMAMTKSAPGLIGWSYCLLHCLIYTVSVCLFLWTMSPLVIVIVFFSHLPIDRWSLAGVWLKLIRGRTFVAACDGESPYREFDIAFTSIVYTVVDNTWHLLLMWYGLTWLV